MADEKPEVTEAAAAKEQVKATPVTTTPAVTVPAPVPAPVAPVAVPAVKAAPAVKPEPEPERMRVKMANATNGATFPGQVMTVDAETGRALIRTGEASRA